MSMYENKNNLLRQRKKVLLLFNHPRFVRIVCTRSKKTAFSDIARSSNTVHRGKLGACATCYYGVRPHSVPLLVHSGTDLYRNFFSSNFSPASARFANAPQ